MTSAMFTDIWQEVLDKLQGGMIPFLTLIEVLCGGQLSQSCYSCSKVVTVGDIVSMDRLESVDGPVLMFGPVGSIQVSLCGKLCAQQNSAKICEEEEYMTLGYTKLFSKYVVDRCDYCSMSYKGVSANRCLNKVYCGEECRDQDWGVHNVIIFI